MSALASQSVLKMLRVQLGAQAMAVEASTVQSIHRAESMQPWPERPELVGRLPLDGVDVAVFRLDALLGFAKTPLSPQQPILVIQSQEGSWGLLVDRVTQLLVPSEQRLPLPTRAVGGAFFDSVIQSDGEMLMVLAAARLFGDSRVFEREPAAPRSSKSGPARRRRQQAQAYLVAFSANAARIGQRPLLFGVSITQVAEIMEAPRLLAVPGAPEHIQGLVNWRNSAIRVVDLPIALGLPRGEEASSHRLMVLRLPGIHQFLGVQVQHTIEMLRLPVPHIASRRALPVDVKRVHEIVELAQATLVIPDLAALDF